MGEILTRLVLLMPAFSLPYAPPVLTDLTSQLNGTLPYPLATIWAVLHPFPLSTHLGTLAGGLGCFPFVREVYPPRAHSQGKSHGIRGLVGFGKREAVPQYISGRTSYLRVRLEFLLYPQLIQRLCTVKWFGPSSAIKRTSPWPWVAHPVSGRIPATFQ